MKRFILLLALYLSTVSATKSTTHNMRKLASSSSSATQQHRDLGISDWWISLLNNIGIHHCPPHHCEGDHHHHCCETHHHHSSGGGGGGGGGSSSSCTDDSDDDDCWDDDGHTHAKEWDDDGWDDDGHEDDKWEDEQGFYRELIYKVNNTKQAKVVAFNGKVQEYGIITNK